MIIRNRSFPYPVLAPFRDDVTPNDFEFTLTVSNDADNFYFDVTFNHGNKTLETLIDQGSAKYLLHFECKRNFFREVFSFSNKSARFPIRASQLVGRVEVSGFIKAHQSIPSYQIDGAHSDYGPTTFQIRAGDVLAVAFSQVFDAYVDYDPLRKISSILTIKRSENVDDGAMKLDTSGNRIEATLSKNDYDRYTDLKADPNIGPLLSNQVVVPALLEGIHEIKGISDEELEFEMSKRWLRSIIKKLEELSIDVRTPDSSPIEAVQALLQMPLRRSLEGLNQMNPLEDAN